MSFIYIVTDCEFDGPIPGQHSMLSFGSVALSHSGESLGEFEVVIEPLPDANQDPLTMQFWRRHPEAWAAATSNAIPAPLAIDQFIAWIKSFDADPIFAAHPVALDGPWFNYYLSRFAGRALFEGPWIPDRLFKHAPLCIMSMVAGATGRDFWQCDVKHYPQEWLGAIEHTHRAIDDARGYAHLLSRLIKD
ncbi:hypothetical protein QE369_001288 [Agrobacterium larrymoorei]|uniref:Uncharacterized protein n=1 Tax=Agrobacterium larrymoorei TaxID=160699 RepID=A0AAJ2EQE0_9HYPH|nr:3'-5' exoribonuclease [Agrobacterium larrymoorei]MDR6101110.1 hypothetical protein [Agrobacterium larrymoorei]